MFDQDQQQKRITLFEFKGHLNELVNKQWVPLFNGKAKRFQINHPNKLHVDDPHASVSLIYILIVCQYVLFCSSFEIPYYQKLHQMLNLGN